MAKIILIYLEGCPYCKKIEEFLKNKGIKYKKILVTHENKEKYKTKEISTFPQLYYKDKHSKILLGGSESFIDLVNNISKINKLNNFTEKQILKLKILLS